MSQEKEQLNISMIREDLEGLPQYELPAGYSLRRWRSGDNQTWTDIESAADKHLQISLEVYATEFGPDKAALKLRQYFLCDAEENAIGTATAWYDNDYHGKPYGRVHWGAIVPHMQGRGLAKPLLSAVCNRLVELGHERAVLGTQTYRIPAICLYMKFGFGPDVRSERDLRAWRGVREDLPPDRRDLLRLEE